MPWATVQVRIVKAIKIQKNMMNEVYHDQHQTVEIEQPTIFQKTIHQKKPIIQEKINEVPKIIE